VLQVLLKRNFALVWLADLVSQIGDWLLFIALPYYVYGLTGSTLATGLTFMLYNVPRLVLSSVAGVLVDRWDRRWTIIAVNATSALVIAPLFLVQSAAAVWIVYLVVFLQACLAFLLEPAQTAFLPLIVDEDDLIPANSLSALINGLTRLVGPPVGGALLSVLGFGMVVIGDVTSFVLAALLLLLVVPRRPRVASEAAAPTAASWSWRSLQREWFAGLTLIWHSTGVTAVLLADGLAMIGYGMVTVLLVVYVRDVLGASALAYGWIATAQGIGVIIGTLATSQLRRCIPLARLYPFAIGTMGIAYLVAANARALPIVLPAFGLAGLGMSGVLVGKKTLIQQAVPNELLGRVTGASATLSGVLILLGMGLASALPSAAGVVELLSGAGTLYVLAGAVGYLRLQRATERSPDAILGNV
jgi:Na+/melibiose symporter-like transporter